jgi:hypothetical protein
LHLNYFFSSENSAVEARTCVIYAHAAHGIANATRPIPARQTTSIKDLSPCFERDPEKQIGTKIRESFEEVFDNTLRLAPPPPDCRRK